MKYTKLLFVLSIFLLAKSYVYSQKKTIDSLLVIYEETIIDTVKVDIDHRIGQLFRSINFDSSRWYHHRSAELAEKIEYIKGYSRALNNIAISFAMQSNYPSAIEYFLKAKEFNLEKNNLDGIRSSLTNMGILYKRIGDYESAFEQYNQSLEIAVSQNDSTEMVRLYQSIGVLYDLMEMEEQALIHFRKALSLSRKIEDSKKSINSLFNSLGIMNLKSGHYDSAEYYFQLYLKSTEEENNELSRSNALSNLGHLYNLTDQPEIALLHLREARRIAEKLELPHELSNVLYNEVNSHKLLGNHSKALETALYNESLLSESQEIDDISNLKKQLAEIYELTGDYSTALKYFKEHKLFSDSLINMENSRKFDNQATKLNVLQKDLTLKQKEFEVDLLNTRVLFDKKFRWIMFISSAILLMLLGIVYYHYRVKLRLNNLLTSRNKLIEQQKREINIINEELESKILRAQMNPHFIFNSLSSIQHFIIKDENESARNYLTKFSKLLRHVLESTIENTVTIKEEIGLLNNYLDLESLRFNNSFSYSIDVSDDVDIESREMPLMLVQPFVENAIIHGLNPSNQENKWIKISFSCEETHLVISVEDNGVGIDKYTNSDKKHKSRGMEVTRKRIERFNRNTIDRYLEFMPYDTSSNESPGTKVIIRLENNI